MNINIICVGKIKEKYILIEVDNNVKLRVDKGSIVKDITDIQTK